MSLQQYYHYEQQNAFLDLSAGTINELDFFNLHSGRQQEEELDDAKVSRTIFSSRSVDQRIF